MTGFDPLDDEPAALTPQGGQGNTGGVGGASGQSDMGGSGSGSGSGGTMGIRPDAGAGSGGTMVVPLSDGSVPMVDAGPPVITSCTGKDNLDDCEDGNHCTDDDFCFNEVCMGGSAHVCGDDCNSGVCNEATDSCEKTPLPNDTKCGFWGAFSCVDGTCVQPLLMCTDGGECTPTCTGSTCNVSCPNLTSCAPSCTNGATCNVDCQSTQTCTVACQDSNCTTMCQGAGICDVDCQGATASCAIFCTDPSGCEESECLDGASCVLQCDEMESCGFKECWAGEQQCGNGKVVCNADCV
jgi:hypothetical protein